MKSHYRITNYGINNYFYEKALEYLKLQGHLLDLLNRSIAHLEYHPAAIHDLGVGYVSTVDPFAVESDALHIDTLLALVPCFDRQRPAIF